MLDHNLSNKSNNQQKRSNPYIVGPSVHGANFFGRRLAYDWVVKNLPYTSSLVLHGQRRIGKSSLLLYLERTLPCSDYLPIYFDLQDQATLPLGQVLAKLAKIMTEKANLKSPSSEFFDNQGDFFCHTFLPK